MFMIDYKELSWWYWLVTACLLTAGVAGYESAFVLAIGLTIVQLVHFTLREGSVAAFPVQVRFWYLMLLLVSLPEPMQWLYWVPTIGTWAGAAHFRLLHDGALRVAAAVEPQRAILARSRGPDLLLAPRSR